MAVAAAQSGGVLLKERRKETVAPPTGCGAVVGNLHGFGPECPSRVVIGGKITGYYPDAACAAFVLGAFVGDKPLFYVTVQASPGVYVGHRVSSVLCYPWVFHHLLCCYSLRGCRFKHPFQQVLKKGMNRNTKFKCFRSALWNFLDIGTR